MKFLARGNRVFRDRSYLKKAAATYLIAKLTTLAIFLYFVDCSACANQRWFVMRGVIHAALFSHFIFIGLLFAMRVLMWLSFARTLLYLTSAVMNTQVFLPVSYQVELLSHSQYGGWVFLLPAALHTLIVYMIVRAIVHGRKEKPNPQQKQDKACPFQTIKKIKNKLQADKVS